MIQSIFDKVNTSYFYESVFPKIVLSVIIFIVAIAAAKITRKVLQRWQDGVLNKAKKRNYRNYSEMRTRFSIINRMIILGIYFFAFILLFLQFEALRNIGTGLLASAGVAGIVIGMAAQNTLGDMLAGISMSFSQPVRLGDAIIFENEFGWVEEIALMHVIIKTWDNRRIVVPNSVFSNKVVQNWTMKDPSLLGVVMMYVDYTCDIAQIKDWVKEVVDKSEFSDDEKVSVVQVVDFTEKTMVLRILAKGPDAPNTWNLRCEIRENIIQKFHEAGLPLPKMRLETVDSKQKGEKSQKVDE